MGAQELEQLQDAYRAVCARGQNLNMARGKPSPEQLDLSMPMLEMVNEHEGFSAEDGTDCRNYGVLEGLPEARKLMACLLDDDPENVIVFGTSSLTIEHDMLVHCLLDGPAGHAPWKDAGSIRWLCPVPGYDRHFAMTESLGIGMTAVPCNEDGPDMDEVERLAASDASIKGIWCVPQYSNPSGAVYSDEVVERLARMECAASDFRIFWDNAYCVHHLYGDREPAHVRDIARACAEAGNPDRCYKFASTSKITFPGAGIAALACSPANKAAVLKRMQAQTIGHDKLNQLRHVRFLRDAEGISEHMRKHAQIIGPKFDLVLRTLERELAGYACTWSNPAGGYFVCFAGPNGTAKRIVELCKQAGVTITGAGAPFPYGNDPNDSVIRIAPTLPSLEELEQALDTFCLCVKIACEEAH